MAAMGLDDLLKKPHEMLFAEFAEAVRPSGAVNRVPAVGASDDVLSYSVYMNGPVAKSLSQDAQEHHYKDVMVHALTEKLGLNSSSFRDNLKVAEIVSVRGAWMSAVLDACLDYKGAGSVLSDVVTNDYALLSKDLSHPWLQGQIEGQRRIAQNLGPALLSATLQSNGSAVERIPSAINQGEILSQNADFTVQAVGGHGQEVVAHENRKLDVLPSVGDKVTVAYYRGNGQVFPSSLELVVSPPFVDQESGNLGVKVADVGANKAQIVLFNGIAHFAQFVAAQKLSDALMVEAVSLQVVIDQGRMAKLAVEPTLIEKLVPAVIAAAKAMGMEVVPGKVADALKFRQGPVSGLFVGKVTGVDDRLGLVFQSQGMGKGVVHVAESLSRVPDVGEMATIKFKDGQGAVADRQQERDRGR